MLWGRVCRESVRTPPAGETSLRIVSVGDGEEKVWVEQHKCWAM